MFNRPNLFRSGCHGLIAHLQALPSIAIMTLSSIAGCCLMPVETGRMLPNGTHLNGRMLSAGRGVRVWFPLAISRITLSSLYRIWSRAILVWFLRCFTSDIFYSRLLAFTLLNAAAARANIADMGNKYAKTLHHCISRHHISQVVRYCCEMIPLIRSWW